MSDENKMLVDALPMASFYVLKELGPPPGMRPQQPNEGDIAYRFACLTAWSEHFVALVNSGAKISLTNMEVEVQP